MGKFCKIHDCFARDVQKERKFWLGHTPPAFIILTDLTVSSTEVASILHKMCVEIKPRLVKYIPMKLRRSKKCSLFRHLSIISSFKKISEKDNMKQLG